MGQLPAPWDCKYLDKEMMRLSWTNILRVFFGTETFASAYGYFSTIIKKEPAVVGYFTPSSHSLEIVYIFVFVQWTKGHKIPVVIHVKHADYLPPWGWQLCREIRSFPLKTPSPPPPPAPPSPQPSLPQSHQHSPPAPVPSTRISHH